MSSAVSSTNVPSTPILVTTPSNETKTPFSDHRRDDSSDDQRHLSKQNSNKTYTRVCATESSSPWSQSDKIFCLVFRATATRTNSWHEVMLWRSQHRPHELPTHIHPTKWSPTLQPPRPSRQRPIHPHSNRHRRSYWQHRRSSCRVSPSLSVERASSTLNFQNSRRQRQRSDGARRRRPVRAITTGSQCLPTHRPTTILSAKISANLTSMTRHLSSSKKQDLK